MNRFFIIIILIFTFAVQAFPCRFTVREIGFSTLSRDNYSIVYLASASNHSEYSFPDLKNRLIDSNIGLMFLDPDQDKEHPAVLAAIKAGLNAPVIMLLAPDGRILQFDETDLIGIMESISSSPLTEIFTANFHNRFAYVVMLESRDKTKNIKANEILKKACEDITNRMPNMPKQVKNGPALLTITPEQYETEKLILWSLGIDEIPESPRAFVIYGRGRIIGEFIDYEAIIENRAFRYLAMIGADCECGLDREWMLGNQIPLNWPLEVRQRLTDELGFDVDNPMILAEMSHILSKDPIEGALTDLSFAPKELNLDELYQSDTQKNTNDEQIEKRAFNPLAIFLLLSGLIVIVGLIIFLKRKSNS